VRFLQDYVPQLESQCKISVLDIDYHHGNGTQAVFYEDPSVLYVSLHAENDYPYFTGSAEERGSGKGDGFNANFPLQKGSTGDEEYCSALSQAIQHIEIFGPAYLVVSLGVDTYEHDPITDFKVTTGGYIRIGEMIASLKKPTLFVMEG